MAKSNLFTAKHYQFFAEFLGLFHNETGEEMLSALIPRFEEDNPKFNEARFRKVFEEWKKDEIELARRGN